MFCVLRLASIAAICIVTGTAFAQSEQWDARRPVPATYVTKEMWRVSRMSGMALYNEHYEKIGTIVELLMRADGRVHAVAVDTSTIAKPNGPIVRLPYDRLGFSELSVRSSQNQEEAQREGRTMTLTDKRIVKIATEGDWKPNHALIRSLTLEQLQAMPAFK